MLTCKMFVYVLSNPWKSCHGASAQHFAAAPAAPEGSLTTAATVSDHHACLQPELACDHVLPNSPCDEPTPYINTCTLPNYSTHGHSHNRWFLCGLHWFYVGAKEC